MADKWPLANGNWSTAANWNNGTLPQAGDDVYADGKTVAIDQDVNVGSIRTTTRSGGTAGGTFTVANARIITCTGASANTIGILSGATTSCLTCSGTELITVNAPIIRGASSTIFGINISGSAPLTINGQVRSHAINSTSTGLITVYGDVIHDSGNAGNAMTISSSSISVTGNVAPTSGNGSYSILATAANCTITIVGSIFGGSGGAVVGGINTTTGSNQIINVTGNITGGTSHFGLGIGGAGTVATVTGNVTGGSSASGASHGISQQANNVNNRVVVYGTVTGSPTGNPGIYDSNTSGGWTIVSGSLIDSAQGDSAVFARRFRVIPTLNTYRRHANNTGYPNGGMITYGSLDYIPNNMPVPANVRYGTVYANNTYTGTCRVPAASSVAAGVAVDNTVGTAALTPSSIASAVASAVTAALAAVP